ncbi:class I SAM-dependent methyltransferase [Bradyrhizobium sp. SYSU BS000235]|uniref:class I SAM-dependent methyltransferase n=1 Tax=Bradyrhizobium sp. SYSU BS000235 TaxID=3411332 RepID=UPI003C71298B
MSGFSAEWLALREPHDLRARNPAVLAAVSAAFRSSKSTRVVDLACGAGSTSRAVAGHLPAQQHWDLVDNDPQLLAVACNRASSNEIKLSPTELDLTADFEVMLDGRKDLITTSALLDLVSEEWLERLVGRSAAHELPVYAALSYDGRIDLSPSDPCDTMVVTAVNAHQLTDKGFGPALGPSAAAAAIAKFEAAGYSVVQGASDWVIGTDDLRMQNELLEGWAAAANEIHALSRSDLDRWLFNRKSFVNERVSTMRVGHVDFFAVPSVKR